ncbi:MAG: hypothetical protein D6794_07005, partial [Deltaproteobacteria bacterium]
MWNFRQSLTRYANRWPWMAALMLLGACLGWGAARLTPPQYRAAAELYVGLHAYRAPDESNRNPSSYYDFRNLDDFKNWQLEQLDQFVRRDEIVAETLRRLQAADGDWQEVTPAELQAMLAPQWRTVGKWQLTVTAPTARMAEQAAETWRTVTLEALQDALDAAAEVMRLDVEMQAVAGAQAALTRRAALLESARAGLEACTANPSPDASLSAARRWQLQALAAQASAFTPAWQSLLADFPPPDAPEDEALTWCAAALAAVTQEQAALPQEQAALQARFEALDAQYREANAASHGLSRNLSLDGVSSKPVRAQPQRKAGGWMLLGASLGALTALLGWLTALG